MHSLRLAGILIVLLCAPSLLEAQNTLWGWGWNEYGQLGNGTSTTTMVPVQIGTDADWVAVTCGYHQTLAIKANGTLWGTGSNAYGALGDGTGVSKNAFVQIGTDTDWRCIDIGNYQAHAIKKNGTLWGWGGNFSGQVGIGNTINQLAPVQIGQANDWEMVSDGVHSSFAIKTDGSLWSWGSNGNGVLGQGDIGTATYLSVPTRIGSASDWAMVAAGSTHAIAVKDDGTLWGWGLNSSGQLGIGSTTNVSLPTQIGDASDWVAASCGTTSSYALKSDGTLWSWGSNSYGLLGIGISSGITPSSTVPVQIGTATDWWLVSPGYSHGLAINDVGELFSWGRYYYGQLGLPSGGHRLSPTQVGTDDRWAYVTGGMYFSMGLLRVHSAPVALCHDVTVLSDLNGVAAASIDNGSYDPDDDAITLVQSPPGPYPVGTTTVTLTVTDARNVPSSCSATVTVIDIRCGERLQKVQVCHNGNTICISPAALPAHLAHGDPLGPCAMPKAGADAPTAPADFDLSQNHPNPFNPSTTITCSIPGEGEVRLAVYDLLGREVARLLDGTRPAGTYHVTFEAASLPSGMYVYQLQWNGAVLSRRMTLLR